MGKTVLDSQLKVTKLITDFKSKIHNLRYKGNMTNIKSCTTTSNILLLSTMQLSVTAPLLKF